MVNDGAECGILLFVNLTEFLVLFREGTHFFLEHFNFNTQINRVIERSVIQPEQKFLVIGSNREPSGEIAANPLEHLFGSALGRNLLLRFRYSLISHCGVRL